MDNVNKQNLIISGIIVLLLLGLAGFWYFNSGPNIADYTFDQAYDEERGCYPANSIIAVNPNYNMECCEGLIEIPPSNDVIGIAGYCVSE